MKQLTILFLLFTFFIANAQIKEQQAMEQLKGQGIYTQDDVKAELARRNITEPQARELAKQYGMDYDVFVKQYIMSDKTVESNVAAPPSGTTEDVIVDAPKAETIVQGQQQATVAEKVQTVGELPYFGYDLFANIPASFEPTAVGPIDPGYLIGPGDMLRLYLWGEVELQYQLEVDQQGNVFIPTAGQFFVSGIQYKDLADRMTAFLSKHYEGLKTEPSTIFLDVSLSKLKPIRIFVLGEVPRPGGYNISSFATVFNALYAVGGPTTLGSLREIRVIRNNKEIAKVDIYDYLLKGRLIGDVRLQNNDVIFIPARKKSVAVQGEVLRPAIYELKENENFQSLLQFAGGVKATGYAGRAQIERIIPFNQRQNFGPEREVVDVDLSVYVNDKNKDFTISDGDKITIFPILNILYNYVTISGSVRRPGNYQINNQTYLNDIIEISEGIWPDTYLDRAEIIRTNLDSTRSFLTIDLKKALGGDPEHNLKLQQWDEIRIYSKYELVERRSVSIAGFVRKPVTIEYADSLTLYDLVFRAGGLLDPYYTAQAFMLRGDLIRINPDGRTTRIIPFDLTKLMSEPEYNMPLRRGDLVNIYKVDVTKVINEFVSINGEVKAPTTLALSTNMTVEDAILQAGGFGEKALRTIAYVNRVIPSGYTGDSISVTYEIPLDMTLGISSRDTTKFILKHKDIISIRRNPNVEDQRLVSVTGQFRFPGNYVLESREEKLSSILKKAGGLSSEAFANGFSLTRGGNRVVLDLVSLIEDGDDEQDIILKSGDVLFIPTKPNVVNVTGGVNNPGLFNYNEGFTVGDYIDRAGGLAEDADYILYTMPNGEINKVGLGLFSSNPDAMEGSTINVVLAPKIVESDDKGPTVWEITRDTLGILVSAITVMVLAKQL